ncbi:MULTISPECIES: acetoacetate--CoA ligase [unclassified Sphingobacterium]|uniref:acetoacetate--CoA ligase n=1 Tax=unclassified Sphingobacterium TaxID=2609468 RepID=UPI0025D96619|nr:MULTISPECIES: acetoacetate--CoA ligase [unclassified Sphingobacterium]
MSELIWTPSADYQKNSALFDFKTFVEERYQLSFRDYETLWKWSVSEPEDFWHSVFQYFDLKSHSPFDAVVTYSRQGFIGTEWFRGATLNYAEHVFRNETDKRPAILYQAEQTPVKEVSWSQLKDQVRAIQQFLIRKGIKEGDRVAGILNNTTETIAIFLAVNAIGAIWSCCSTDFGSASIVERFTLIEPRILFADSGYNYNGKKYDKQETAVTIKDQISSITDLVMVNGADWDLIMQEADHAQPLTFQAVSFDHPIWILYSSGTTGKPKAITHSSGGNLIEHYKALALHQNVQEGDRFMWYTTTGWMMWNYAVSSLLVGATLCIYDGSPIFPERKSIWNFVADHHVDHLGAGAAYFTSCQDLSLSELNIKLKTIGSTGSPLPPDTFQWLQGQLKDVQIVSLSGGTDVCSAFLSGSTLLPVFAGEIQCRTLGSKIEAYNEDGVAVYDEVGELVIEVPMPSMPLYFWKDKDNAKYLESYFDKYPGVWCHGDWIKITRNNNGIIMYGRSDATLNRGGVRIGTAEVYNVLNTFEDVEDSLVICIDLDNGDSVMPLYIKMKAGVELTDELRTEIKKQLRSTYSPRHVPDEILAVPDIPYTMSGKKLEIPVKKLMMGVPIDRAVSIDVVKNPDSLNYWIDLRKKV